MGAILYCHKKSIPRLSGKFYGIHHEASTIVTISPSRNGLFILESNNPVVLTIKDGMMVISKSVTKSAETWQFKCKNLIGHVLTSGNSTLIFNCSLFTSYVNFELHGGGEIYIQPGNPLNCVVTSLSGKSAINFGGNIINNLDIDVRDGSVSNFQARISINYRIDGTSFIDGEKERKTVINNLCSGTL